MLREDIQSRFPVLAASPQHQGGGGRRLPRHRASTQPGQRLPAVAQGGSRTTRGRFTEQYTAYTVSLTKHCTHSLTEQNTVHTGSLYKTLHTQAR